jgi:hypothetical protein
VADYSEVPDICRLIGFHKSKLDIEVRSPAAGANLGGRGKANPWKKLVQEVLVAGSLKLIQPKIRRPRNSLAVSSYFRMFIAGRVELNRLW